MPRAEVVRNSTSARHLGPAVRVLGERRLRVRERQPGAVERPVGALERRDRLRREAAPSQPFAVDAERLGRVARRRSRTAARPAAASCPPPIIACAPIRTNWCTPVKPPRIAQSPMWTWPASWVLLAKHGVAPDLAVVREVHVGHDPVVVADARDAGVLRRAAVEACSTRGWCCGRRSRAASARRRTSCPAAARRWTQKLEDAVVAADARGPVDDACGPIAVPSPISTCSPMIEYGADAHVRAERAPRVDDRGRMDHPRHGAQRGAQRAQHLGLGGEALADARLGRRTSRCP